MNITDVSLKSQKCRHNSPLLPSSIRGLIVGRSNCGKTVLLLNLLLKPNWLDYNNLLVFGNSLHQPEYQIIRAGFEAGLGKTQILNIFENPPTTSPIELIQNFNGIKEGGVSAEFYEDCEQIPDPKTLDPKLKNLLVLDDCYLGKQGKARAYYTRGRHNNCDSLYISQNYFALPRNSVRENSNLIILFPQNTKSIQHIHADHCTDIPFQEFKDLCTGVWAHKYNFITIDLTSPPHSGKYRRNLETFYIPHNVIH